MQHFVGVILLLLLARKSCNVFVFTLSCFLAKFVRYTEEDEEEDAVSFYINVLLAAWNIEFVFVLQASWKRK